MLTWLKEVFKEPKKVSENKITIPEKIPLNLFNKRMEMTDEKSIDLKMY